MSDDIKKGDMVRLKSGGPNMMVNNVGQHSLMGESGGDIIVSCEWFDAKMTPQAKTFALTSVEKVPPQPSSAALGARGPRVV